MPSTTFRPGFREARSMSAVTVQSGVPFLESSFCASCRRGMLLSWLIKCCRKSSFQTKLMRGVKSTCSWLIDADCTSYHRARCKRGQNSFDVSNMVEAASSIQYDKQNTQDGCQRWRAGNNNLFVQVKLRILRCSPHIEWRSCLSEGTVNVARC